MTDSDSTNSPTEKAQSAYNNQIKLLKELYGKDILSFEIASHELLGHNSLKLILNEYGDYDAGWIDEFNYDENIRNRLLAMIRQDSVTNVAATISILKNIHVIGKSIKTIKWLLVVLCFLAIFILLFK